MSDKEYSSKEKRRMNRSQRHRRAHDMSSSSSEEDEAGNTDNSEREDEADSAEELIAKVSTGCKTLIHDNSPSQDMNGPQLSKEGVKNAMKGTKRVDKVAPNMILN